MVDKNGGAQDRRGPVETMNAPLLPRWSLRVRRPCGRRRRAIWARLGHLAIVAAVWTVAGCRDAPRDAPHEGARQPRSDPAVSAGTTRDPHGPTPQRSTARRIVSQVVLADEILWELGPEARRHVVGLSAMADDPRFSRVHGQWPAHVPRIATGSEALVAQRPDLVILASFSSVELRALLERSEIPLLVLSGWAGFDDYRTHVRQIGAAAGTPGRAAELLQELDRALAELPPMGRDRPTIVSFSAGSVAGSGTTFDDVATRAGYQNLTAARGMEGHGTISMETLLVWDPDVILTSCGATSCDGAPASGALHIVTDPVEPGLAASRAAKAGDLLGAPGSLLYSTGAGLVVLTRALAEHRVARAKGGA